MSGPGPRKYPQLNMTQKRTYSRNINITKKAEHMRTESVTLLEAREVFSYNFFASVYVHTTPRTKWQLIKASLLDGSVDCIFKASRIHKIDVASRSTTCSEKTVTTSKLEEYRKVRATADFQWALCRHLSHKTPISDAISDAVKEFLKSCLALCICFMVYLLVVQVSITYYLMQLQVYLMNLQLPLHFFYSFDGQDLFMISRLIYLFFYMVGAVLLLVLLKKFVNVCYVAFGVRAMDDTVYTIFFVLGLVLCVTYFNMFAVMTEEQWSQSLLHMVVRGLEHFFMDKAPYIIVCGFISHVTRTLMGIINSQVSSMWQLCKYTIVFEIIFFMILPDAFFTYDFLLNNAIGSVVLCIWSCVVSSISYILLLLFSPSNLGSRSLSIVMPFLTLGYIGVIFIVYDFFIGVAYTMNDAFQLHLSNGILYGMVIVCVLIIELGFIFFIVRFYSISYSIFASFSTNITLEAYIAALKGALRGDFEAYKLLKRDPAHAQVFYDVLKFDDKFAGLHNMSRFNPTYYIFVFFAHIFFDWWKVIPASGYVVRFIITFFVCNIFLFLPLVLFFL
jgi:hypothetical protein